MSTPQRRFKDAIYEQLARVGKAVASPRRIELLELLSQGPRTVESLATLTGLSVANASQHLRALRGARLVETQKKGLYVEYRLADPQVGDFFVALRGLAEARLAEVAQISRDYLQQRDTLEPVSARELARRARLGEVTVLDVRPPEEYGAAHLPGAVSIPLPELEARLHELPDDREVVAYCRGRHCVMSIDAVQLLRARGYSARRMDDGVLDWRAQGLRLAHGARP